jgi:hypothetical protein
MALSKHYESTIVKVGVCFSFSDFSCAPADITAAMNLEPDEMRIEGEPRTTKWGPTILAHESSWTIESRSSSKDVNEHLRELLLKLSGKEGIAQPDWNPAFSVSWKGSYLYAGSGPFYEVDVLAGIARQRAALWQDIYQVDEEEPLMRIRPRSISCD